VLIALDFDGTIVKEEGRAFSDFTSPLEFLPGAREALYSLKRAQHSLLLWSARSNRSLLQDPQLDPLVRAGVRRPKMPRWEAELPVHFGRLRQMEQFIATHLAGVFDAVDDGVQGKPLADLFIDNRALRYGFGPDAVGWQGVQVLFGEPPKLIRETTNVRR
jgi:beta-phosphoglucomutase-like phosphatase (HAD superfamily)